MGKLAPVTIRAARITAMAVIVAAIIGGVFTLLRKSPSQQIINSPGALQAGRDININTNQDANPTGILKPLSPNDGYWSNYGSYYSIHDGKYLEIEHGGQDSLFTIDMATNAIIFPFGDTVPIWITKTLGIISVSGEFKSLDGKIRAELINNEWTVNHNNYFKLNYDDSALEVIDDYGVPWLQVERLTPKTIRICGVFITEDKVTSSSYPNFPNTKNFVHLPTPIGAGWPGAIFTVSNTEFHFLGKEPHDTEEQRRDLTERFRHDLKPLFDYTPSKGLGVRAGR